MKKEKSQCLKQQLCVQAGEQRCHAGCWESSLLPDDSHSCSSAVTPFSFNHRPPWSCPLLLADCLDAEFSSSVRTAHLENKATSSKSKSTWWESSLGGDLHQPFSILDYMPNKRRKGSPLLVIWLRKVGQQPRNMIDWNIRGRLPSIQTSVHGLLDMVKKKHFHHICVCTLYLFKEWTSWTEQIVQQSLWHFTITCFNATEKRCW